MAEITKKEKLEAVHNVDKVYAKVAGANNEITFDAKVDGKKIPVTTKNFDREENHFVFEKAEFKDGE